MLRLTFCCVCASLAVLRVILPLPVETGENATKSYVFLGIVRDALSTDVHASFGPEADDRVEAGVVGDNDHFG